MGNIFGNLKSAKGQSASAQAKANFFTSGWANTFSRFRSIAVIVLVVVIIYVLVSTILSKKKFFPRQPTRHQLRTSQIIKDIKDFDALHFPKNVKGQQSDLTTSHPV